MACPDVAGRGESDRLPYAFQYHFPQFLADLDRLLEELDADAVDWVGTSMGGLLGMFAAGRHGNRVRRLVMNDVGAYLPMGALAYIGRNLDSPERFDSLAEVERHIRHTHREWGELTDEQWRHLARHGARPADGGYRLHYDPQIARLVQPFPAGPGLFFWDRWAQVRCPVLLLRGEDSRVFPREVANLMVAMKPGTRLVEIPGCGHAPALMSEAQVATVRGFLDESPPLSSADDPPGTVQEDPSRRRAGRDALPARRARDRRDLDVAGRG